jgi:hypothetical protein
MKTSNKSKSNWTVIVPVSGIRLTNATNNEFTIGEVTFIDSKKLPYKRIKFGIPYKISELKTNFNGILNDVLNSEHNTLAIVHQCGERNDIEKKITPLVTEAIDILSLSQLGYSRRSHNSKPSIYYNYCPERFKCLLIEKKSKYLYLPRSIKGKSDVLTFDERWLNYQKHSFFYNLVKIVSGKDEKIKKNFKYDLKRAAILVGQSVTHRNLAQCFLWNMIALEILLTDGNDRYSEKLPERVEAFIGWTHNWKIDNFSKRIVEIYVTTQLPLI